jgi:hypothetical protein
MSKNTNNPTQVPMRHTKNRFKDWLSKAKYVEVLNETQNVRNNMMIMRNTRNEPPRKGVEQLKILRYKYSLLLQKLYSFSKN